MRRSRPSRANERASNTRTERTREKKRGRERKREAERHGKRVASSFPASRDDEQRALCFDEGCLAAAGGCNPGLFIGRKRETKETEDTRHVVLLRRAREHFRTDNVDPIENANASCLKAIDCFSSNTSETAAPCSLLFPRPHFLPRSPPCSFSRRVDGKFVGKLRTNAVLADVNA